ncbi:MAG: ATPase, T2SS/T4P/T4SS family [Verrucomicrobiota bacterium]|jgi:type II secretory ATPase GspE/PulE/Tfp pilus assembly ATPase PilB-like protein
MSDATEQIRTAENAESSVPMIVEELIHQAEQAMASDIHLQMENGAAVVSFRLDGLMTPATKFSPDIAERVFGRIKFLARLKTYQESMPQDGRIDQRAVHGRSDIRVATYPTVTGEKIVLRLFNPVAAKGLAELEFCGEAAGELRKFLRQPSGMLLLTGPAGSGKTTTIYACVRALAETGGRHIITIEDPVEQIVPGVMQTEVNEARGLDFAKAARHLLRQDPQAFVIGEIRDEETAGIAVRAALTGHLVISTLHAGSCKGVLERLLVMCPDRSAIAAAVDLVFNQRLMRKLCRKCLGTGCPECWQTGYQGRAPLVEWLRITDALRAQIRTHQLQSVAPQCTLEESARALLQRGITNQPEYERIFGL